MGASHQSTYQNTSNFSITPNANYFLTITSITFLVQSTSDNGTGISATDDFGPTNFAIRSSHDGYSNNLLSGTIPLVVGSSTACSSRGGTIPTITAPVGNTLYLRLYAWGGDDAIQTMRLDNFSVVGNVVLPITLSRFDLELMNQNQVAITFETSSEINNNFFEIQHSTDGVIFSKRTQIKGQGQSSTRHLYHWVDSPLPPGVHYYRLMQVDYDGHHTYSEVQVVEVLPMTNMDHILLFPNPVEDILHINTISSPFHLSKYLIEDWRGRILRKGHFPPFQDEIQLPLSDLPTGVLHDTVFQPRWAVSYKETQDHNIVSALYCNY